PDGDDGNRFDDGQQGVGGGPPGRGTGSRAAHPDQPAPENRRQAERGALGEQRPDEQGNAARRGPAFLERPAILHQQRAEEEGRGQEVLSRADPGDGLDRERVRSEEQRGVGRSDHATPETTAEGEQQRRVEPEEQQIERVESERALRPEPAVRQVREEVQRMVGVELDLGERRPLEGPAAGQEKPVAGDEPVVAPVQEVVTERARMQQRRAETHADGSSGAGPETLEHAKTLPGSAGGGRQIRKEPRSSSARTVAPRQKRSRTVGYIVGQFGSPFRIAPLLGQGQPTSVEPGRQSEQLMVLLSMLVLIPVSSVTLRDWPPQPVVVDGARVQQGATWFVSPQLETLRSSCLPACRSCGRLPSQ